MTEEQKSAILDSSEVPWQFFLPIFLKSRKRLHKHNLRKGVNFMKNVTLINIPNTVADGAAKPICIRLAFFLILIKYDMGSLTKNV